MIQKIYVPQNAKLRQIVNFMSYVAFTSEDHLEGWPAIFPNATSNLMLSLDDDIDVNFTPTDSAIYITCSSTVAFRPYVGLRFMTVQFNSYGMYYAKGIPVSELHDTLFALDSFFKASEVDEITSRLREPTSIEEKFETLETFLLQRIKIPDIDPRLPYAIAALKLQQHYRIDDLSEALCLSSRGLLKLFKKHVGISPAYYKKIARFNQAASLVLNRPEIPLTQIAFECGYYDQAHFIKDFREFGGISPSDFLQLRAKSSDFYNYILKDIDSLAPS